MASTTWELTGDQIARIQKHLGVDDFKVHSVGPHREYDLEGGGTREVGLEVRVQTAARAKAGGQPYYAIWDVAGRLFVFSNNWFHELTRPHWEEHIPNDFVCESYLEIGVCEGQSLVWVMQNLHPLRVDAVDPYIPGRNNQVQLFIEYENRVCNNTKYWQQITHHRVRSDEWLRGVGPVQDPGPPPDKHYDFIYVDGDHRGQFCATDLVNAWWKLNVGGIMCIDDFNRRWARSQPSTWEAATGFILAFDHQFEWIYRTKKQLCIRKLMHG